MTDRWQEEMQARGLVDENGWFVHRLWRVAVPTVGGSKPLAKPNTGPTHHDRIRSEAAREALLKAADTIQALHPGEIKNSVIFLRQRADNIALQDWLTDPSITREQRMAAFNALKPVETTGPPDECLGSHPNCEKHGKSPCVVIGCDGKEITPVYDLGFGAAVETVIEYEPT